MRLSWTAAISMTIPERPKSLGPNVVLTLAGSVGLGLVVAVGFPRPFDARSSTRHLSRHGRRFLSRRVRGGPPFLHLTVRFASCGAVSLFSRRGERRTAGRQEPAKGQAGFS